MPLNTDAPKSHVPRISRRKILCLFGCVFLVGLCVFVVSRHYNLDAPSVSLRDPIDVTWDHLQSERWDYTLHHETRVAYLGFWPHDGVATTMGTRDGARESVTGIRYKWRITAPSRLEFTDEDGVTVYFTFDLNNLTKNTAVVTDVSNGEVLLFDRNYHGQTGG